MDSPFFRHKNCGAVNTVHALVDPSHTFIETSPQRHNKTMDFRDFNFKEGKDKTSEWLQQHGLETFDYGHRMIRRLKERRDMTMSTERRKSPVDEFFETKRSSENFFKLPKSSKVDLNKLVTTNYMVRSKD